jgi:hypothetical protein
VYIDKVRILADNKISLGKFKKGGAAIFIITLKNQNKENKGEYLRMPLDKRSLREEVIS